MEKSLLYLHPKTSPFASVFALQGNEFEGFKVTNLSAADMEELLAPKDVHPQLYT